MFGGSQGARRLDQVIAADHRGAAATASDLQLLVATGPGHIEEVAPAAAGSAGRLLVRVVGFIERMDLALAVADLAVARAGSGTASPSLPLRRARRSWCHIPHATENHQEANAREFEQAGAAEVCSNPTMTPAGLARGSRH